MVSDAAPPSGASSYQVHADGTVSTITGLAATGQAAACWTVITRNGRYAYVTNTASGNISGFAIGHDGSLTVLDGGITATTGGSPSDAAITGNGRYLYVRNANQGALNAFRIGHDGSLAPWRASPACPPGPSASQPARPDDA